MPSHNVKRASALLATTALTLSGFALAPLAYAADTPAASSTTSSSAHTISDATMSWGLKESFRNYINGPIAHGSVDVADGLEKSGNGILNFSAGTGTYDPATRSGSVSFPGSVSYSGHNGQLDIQLHSFKLVINGNQGTLQVSGSSKDMQGNTHNFSDTDFASVDLTGAVITEDSITLNEGATALLESGAPAFASFYSAGTELDALTFSAPLTAPEAEETAPELPAFDGTEDNLSAGTLSWGIKDSFINYLARTNAITTSNGATLSDQNIFGFENGVGTYDEETQTGTIYYPGTIHFYAHGGVLDIALTNLTINIKGDGTGTISADGYTKLGEYISFTDRDLVTLDLSGLTYENGVLSVQDAAAQFTDEGGSVFGRYSSATAADPVSFSANVSSSDEPSPEPTVAPTAEPSASPTAAPTADPSATAEPSASPTVAPTADPSADPTTSPEAESTRFKVESGTMNWGFKDSYRNYITGPIANGGWELSEGISAVSSGFDWSNVIDGAFDTETKEGFVKFGGSVHFQGHNGKLNQTFSNIQFQTYLENGELKGYIVADVESHLLDGNVLTKENLAIAVVNLESLNFEGKKVTLEAASTALTEAGALAFATEYNAETGEFSSMYKAGDVLSALTINLVLGEQISDDVNYDRNDIKGDNTKTPDADAEETDSNEAEGTGGSTGNGSSTTKTSTTLGAQGSNGASSNPGSAAIATCVPVQTTEVIPGQTTEQVTGKATVSNASMDWGLRSSFRNYIAGGIANGGWDLSGVTYNSGAFNFTGGTGSLENSTGEISFNGSIHFYGHKGVLSTTFSNLSLSINGKTGVLYANVVSNDMEGQAKDYGRVAFADVDLSSLNITADKVTISSAATVLTATGAEAFAGFYSAGEALDPISLSGDLTSETTTVKGEDKTVTKTTYKSVNGADCSELNSAANGNLAYTGMSNTTKVAVFAGALLLVAGSAAVVMVARRRQA